METPILEGPGVRLEPLSLNHLPALEAVAFDPAVWRYMLFTIRTPVDLRCWVEAALHARDKGIVMPWVTIKKACGDEPDRLVGSTRFIDLDMNHHTVEIGHTWLGSPWRGTRVNTEAKLLQLTYAFDTLGLLRVAFKAHANNQKSLSAIKAIGATYEGTFRSHYVMPDGSARDSAWFSIIKKEWPEVKEMLTRRLNSPV
jgi:RimJ/RimL family protein N-acetyltransferase